MIDAIWLFQSVLTLILNDCSVVELRFRRGVLMEATVLCLVLKRTYLFAVVVCINLRLPKLLLKPA